MSTAVRLGIVGYSVGGRLFHAPFVEAAEGIELAGVVTRDPQRRTQLKTDHPGVPVFDSLAEMLAHGHIEAVTITTPPGTRRELVLDAVAAGVHVVADKPFAPAATGGRELADAAQRAGVLLNVFHNRRWDADVQTLRGLLEDGRLGELWRVHSRFDLDQPDLLEAGPAGGLLRDLGAHVIDQMAWLLGPVRSVTAHLDLVHLPEGETDAGFVVQMHHVSGVLSVVESSKLNHLDARELRAYGSKGSFRHVGIDVQGQALFAGQRPADDLENWGRGATGGVLSTASGDVELASARGGYQDFYTAFAAAIRVGGDGPSPAHDAIATLAILDAARQSAATGTSITVPSH
ncbi:MAG: dehydrogenase [Nocardioides sp.]|jgi:predicted dehydrogenase|uniref:Gfo/Idh/MocA family protein n=1 Tax=Nocardioides sp. TaxID=35761 RepID=UPI002633215B|nr:Gfo/Idh/MocA family oxidoreductase [Nocardioides sp.]MCW2835275.1 dehydrogenase [Nocardioides sp.]